MTITKTNLVKTAGWYGVTVILLAYTLVSFKIILSNSYSYQLLNLTGAIGIVICSLSKKDKQPAVLNIIWAIVAFIAIVALMIHS